MDLERSAFSHYLCEKGMPLLTVRMMLNESSGILVTLIFSNLSFHKAHYCCRISTEDYGVVGLRYGSENLSVGAALMPLACM
jgi:hypothetical protein